MKDGLDLEINTFGEKNGDLWRIQLRCGISINNIDKFSLGEGRNLKSALQKSLRGNFNGFTLCA